MAQLVHVLPPGVVGASVTLPGPQTTQAIVELGLYCPGGQAVQDVAPEPRSVLAIEPVEQHTHPVSCIAPKGIQLIRIRGTWLA